jgi:hypothetical protein
VRCNGPPCAAKLPCRWAPGQGHDSGGSAAVRGTLCLPRETYAHPAHLCCSVTLYTSDSMDSNHSLQPHSCAGFSWRSAACPVLRAAVHPTAVHNSTTGPAAGGGGGAPRADDCAAAGGAGGRLDRLQSPPHPAAPAAGGGAGLRGAAAAGPISVAQAAAQCQCVFGLASQGCDPACASEPCCTLQSCRRRRATARQGAIRRQSSTAQCRFPSCTLSLLRRFLPDTQMGADMDCSASAS